MGFVIVLKLENDKWFILLRESSKFILETNFNCEDSEAYQSYEFTKKYPPMHVHEIKPNCNEFYLDKYVKMYMNEYGIDNVRGGRYFNLNLSDEEKRFIQQELWYTNNKCIQYAGVDSIQECNPPKYEAVIASNNINYELLKIIGNLSTIGIVVSIVVLCLSII